MVCIIEDLKKNKYFCKQCIISNAVVINMMKNEALTLLKLKSLKNISKLHDYGFRLGECYIIYDFIDAVGIHCYISSISLNEKINLMIKVLEQVELIHNLGIIHCDLKPSNILVDKNGEVHITDFEISSEIGKNKFPKYGSFLYCSIEQIKGEKCSFQTDIYSLGVILYELITEKSLFSGSKENILNQKLKNIIPSTGISKVDYIIKKAIEIDPTKRYKIASGFKNDLIQIIK